MATTVSLKQVPGTNKKLPTDRVHGVLVSVKHVGVLITGKSGIGKSECALELMLRGYKLVADDLVVITLEHGKLTGRSDPLLTGYLELQGLGVIKVQSHFGKYAMCSGKQIDMVINFVDWNESNHARGFIKPSTYGILNIMLPFIKLPVRPARNMASLVEVAVTSFLLKKSGIEELKELEQRISKKVGNTEWIKNLR